MLYFSVLEETLPLTSGSTPQAEAARVLTALAQAEATAIRRSELNAEDS